MVNNFFWPGKCFCNVLIIYKRRIYLLFKFFKKLYKKVEKVLNCSKKAGLTLNIAKYKFVIKIIKYLRFIINIKIKLRMNLKNYMLLKNKKFSKLFKKMRNFLRFVNFYKKFIDKYSDLTELLLTLIRKKPISIKN